MQHIVITNWYATLPVIGSTTEATLKNPVE